MSRRLEIQVGEFICRLTLKSHAKRIGSLAALGKGPRGLTKLQGSMTLKLHFARMSAESEDGSTSLGGKFLAAIAIMTMG